MQSSPSKGLECWPDPQVPDGQWPACQAPRAHRCTFNSSRKLSNIHKVSISHYIIYNRNNRLLVIGNSGQIIQREKGKKEQINTRVNKKLRKICQKELNQRITDKNVGVLVLHDWLEHKRMILYTEHNWNNVVKLATRTVKEPRITKMCFGGQNLKCPSQDLHPGPKILSLFMGLNLWYKGWLIKITPCVWIRPPTI